MKKTVVLLTEKKIHQERRPDQTFIFLILKRGEKKKAEAFFG